MNLAYYLNECYIEVRRTPDEPRSAAYIPQANPLPAGHTLIKKREKFWGMGLSTNEKTPYPKTTPRKTFVRFTSPFLEMFKTVYYA